MEWQNDLNEKMRVILVDWLVDVHVRFKLVPETLFLCVNILDRYLAKADLLRNKFQLLGVTALFIASKFEEIHPPELHDFVYITDNAYTKEQILEMECFVVSELEFAIVTASPLLFLHRFARLAKFEKREFFFCQYLLELSLLDYDMLAYKPSIQAAATVYLIGKSRGFPLPWPEELREVTGIEAVELIEPAKKMAKIHLAIKEMEFKAVTKKFHSEKFLCVSQSEFSN